MSEIKPRFSYNATKHFLGTPTEQKTSKQNVVFKNKINRETFHQKINGTRVDVWVWITSITYFSFSFYTFIAGVITPVWQVLHCPTPLYVTKQYYLFLFFSLHILGFTYSCFLLNPNSFPGPDPPTCGQCGVALAVLQVWVDPHQLLGLTLEQITNVSLLWGDPLAAKILPRDAVEAVLWGSILCRGFQ